uniref:SPRY-associated domain-containing protein n=1 Tax=Seriola dumerili TaxID=41447 RepID=A0A3B4UXP9_SERDU
LMYVLERHLLFIEMLERTSLMGKTVMLWSKKAEVFIRELEEEITELRRGSSELEQLSRTEDHFQLLQSFPSLNLHTKDWKKVQVHSSCEATLWRSLKRVQQYAVDVTLDPDTANPYLVMYDDVWKKVNCGDVKKNFLDNPQRLSSCAVLGKQSFSSGRFYYEVQVKGKTKWDSVPWECSCWSFCPSLFEVKAKQGGSLIFSFTECNFNEKLYPYFSPCLNYGGKTSAPLIISPITHTHSTYH